MEHTTCWVNKRGKREKEKERVCADRSIVVAFIRLVNTGGRCQANGVPAVHRAVGGRVRLQLVRQLHPHLRTLRRAADQVDQPSGQGRPLPQTPIPTMPESPSWFQIILLDAFPSQKWPTKLMRG